MPPLKREVAKICKFSLEGFIQRRSTIISPLKLTRTRAVVADVKPIPSLKGLGRKRPSQSQPYICMHATAPFARGP